MENITTEQLIARIDAINKKLVYARKLMKRLLNSTEYKYYKPPIRATIERGKAPLNPLDDTRIKLVNASNLIKKMHLEMDKLLKSLGIEWEHREAK